jgi:hypothetical protein
MKFHRSNMKTERLVRKSLRSVKTLVRKSLKSGEKPKKLQVF